LALSFHKTDDKKPTKKTDDKKPTIKIEGKKRSKTSIQQEQLLASMSAGREYHLRDFCDLLGLKETRTKEIIKSLIETGKIIVVGENRNRTYMLK
jgi:predicted transcriptional regulator